jgi:hypothetical protein
MQDPTTILINPNFPGGEDKKQFSFDHSYWSHDGFIENPDVTVATEADPMHQNGFKYATQVGHLLVLATRSFFVALNYQVTDCVMDFLFHSLTRTRKS